MTVRQPFQRLLAALAIASGLTAYGASIQLFAGHGSHGGGGGGGSHSSGGHSSSHMSSGGSRSSGHISSGGSARISSGSSSHSSGGSIRMSGGSSGSRSSGGANVSFQRDRSSGRNDGGSRNDGGVKISTPRIDSSPRISTPNVDVSPRRIDTPRIDTSRIQTPRIDNNVNTRNLTPRIDSNSSTRIQTPRIDTPRIDTSRNNNLNLGDNVIPRTTNRGPDVTPRIENRNNLGGSTNLNGNRLDTNVRNRNQVDVNGGKTGVGSNTQLDTKVTPRSNNLPNNVQNNLQNNNNLNLNNRRDATGLENAANRLRDNADKIGNRTNDGTSNAADRLRDNATRLDNKLNDRTNNGIDLDNAANRLRGNADRLGNNATNDANNALRNTDRLGNNADRLGNKANNDANNVLKNADRVDRNNLDPKLRDQLDRARGNRNNLNVNDQVNGNANARVRDRIGDFTGKNANKDVLSVRDSVKPIVANPNRLDPEVRSRIEANQRITVRNNNNQTIDLTPFNRPGVGANLGRTNIAARQTALNGLLHTSRLNRNVALNGRFNDWNVWNGNNYWRHNNWHRGYWNFNRWNGFYGPNWWGFGLGWGYGWGGGWGGWGGGWGGWGGGWGYPIAYSFGLTPWGMNYLGYGFGLYDYYNPYCYQPVPFYGGYSYDYTQPLIVNYGVNNYGASLPGTVVQNIDQQPAQAEPDTALFDQARTAFTSGDYQKALQLTEQQIQKTPKDSIIHEFRGLVLFALGRFEDAAIPVYAVLAVGPGWDWATMSSLYPSVDVYASQLKALEDFHRSNPDNAAVSFLLAYHYLTCGHNEAAASQLDNVLRINPQDIVATRLLQALGDGTQKSPEELPAPKDDNTATMPLTVPDIPAPPPTATVTAEELYGTWQAQNSKGKTFTLTLTKDGTFEWESKDDQKTIDQKGVFGVEGESLAMEPDGGGVLVGKVSKPENGSFKLELVGGLPDDKALEFKMVNK